MRTTFLGKLEDTEQVAGTEGANVYPRTQDWTPEKGMDWLRSAVMNGDNIVLLSDNLTGMYRQEVEFLINWLVAMVREGRS